MVLSKYYNESIKGHHTDIIVQTSLLSSLHRRHGFTIVELLIVIVVIGILAAISIVAYGSVQQKARDSARKTAINSIAKSLDMHYADNGSYTQPENRTSDYSLDGTNDWAPDSDLRDLITGGYMQRLPIDPKNNSTYYYSYEPLNAGEAGYAAAGQGFDLCARLELGGTYCVSRRT